MTLIDLNADLGEGMPDDAAMLGIVTSCSVACGGHAGDEASMTETLRAARAAGVVVGAHPSYPDREHFGRRTMRMDPDDLIRSLTGQVAALLSIAAREAVPLRHLKPHGALYNDAARDEGLALILARLTADLLPGAALIGPPNSALAKAARLVAIPFLAEGFADRAYRADGSLVPRSAPGAVIDGPDRADRAVRLATERALPTGDGGSVSLPIQTICLHGDAPGAGAAARAVRDALQAAGVTVRAPHG